MRDSERVFATLEGLKVRPGPLSEAAARRLAELLDADRLVSGRVRAAGGRLRIDLSLLAADLPGVPAQSFHAESAPADAFRLIEQLGATLREGLAAPPVTAEPAVRSPAALAAYQRALQNAARRHLAAVEPLERRGGRSGTRRLGGCCPDRG